MISSTIFMVTSFMNRLCHLKIKMYTHISFYILFTYISLFVYFKLRSVYELYIFQFLRA